MRRVTLSVAQTPVVRNTGQSGELPKWLARDVDALVQMLVAEVRPCAILLLGSAARGELCYTQCEGRPLLLSDLELLVVADHSVPRAAQRRVAQMLETMEAQIDPISPLFYIDVSFRTRSRLRSLPLTVSTFELRRYAQVLWGDDVRHLIRLVTPASVNLLDANEYLYTRLWPLMLHVPAGLLTGEALSWLDRLTFAVVCARSALAVPAALLPHAGVLLPTFHERVAHVREQAAALPFGRAIGGDLQPLLDTCLAMRQAPSATGGPFSATLRSDGGGLNPLLHLYQRVVDCLASALGYVGYTFSEQPISRGQALNVARLAGRIAGRCGPVAAARWLMVRRKRHLAAGLLAMHRALLAYLNGEADVAWLQLASAREHLKTLSACSPVTGITGISAPVAEMATADPSFAGSWLALRRGWAAVWCDLMCLGSDRARHHMDRLLG
jgi:hypothetical protein